MGQSLVGGGGLVEGSGDCGRVLVGTPVAPGVAGPLGLTDARGRGYTRSQIFLNGWCIRCGNPSLLNSRWPG